MRKSGVFVSRAKRMNTRCVEEYFKLLESVISENNLVEKPGQSFNMDEIELQFTFASAPTGDVNPVASNAELIGQHVNVVTSVPTNSERFDSADLVQDDSMSVEEWDEDKCVGCGEAYNETTKKEDWVKSVQCCRWFHEGCSRFEVKCDFTSTRQLMSQKGKFPINRNIVVKKEKNRPV
ncbi:unnamed protein product [Diabrotica balteata]|uniref:Uncharacterized protein n=1 Tax=Diabrotica balteata TaxID=107213 RepID=A0A9N9XEZ4_DIABA|nr:unnamed protein product [Diabrotica balteata]